jgi:hypothetical protein
MLYRLKNAPVRIHAGPAKENPHRKLVPAARRSDMARLNLADAEAIAELALDWGGGPVVSVFLIGVGFVIWRAMRARRKTEGARLSGRIGMTRGARFKEQLPDSIHLLAAFGEDRAGPQLRTTWGLRLVALITSAAFLGFIWLHSPGLYIPTGGPTLAATLLPLYALGEVWLFRATVDADGLVTRRWHVLRRSWKWDDLVAVNQDGGYEMVLDFGRSGRARIPKHLAGIDDLFTLAGQALDRNDPASCRNYPRSKPFAEALFRSWRGGGSLRPSTDAQTCAGPSPTDSQSG